MDFKQAIRNSLTMGDRFIGGYIGDLTDAELLIRPIPGMNHIAWQLGHLVGTERHLVELIKPGSCPELPPDFQEGHGRRMTEVDDPSKYYSLAIYQELMKAQRAATLVVLDSLTDADLDRTHEKFPSFAPNVGAVLGICGNHPIVHAGQFVAVRRLLSKPVSF